MRNKPKRTMALAAAAVTLSIMLAAPAFAGYWDWEHRLYTWDATFGYKSAYITGVEGQIPPPTLHQENGQTWYEGTWALPPEAIRVWSNSGFQPECIQSWSDITAQELVRTMYWFPYPVTSSDPPPKRTWIQAYGSADWIANSTVGNSLICSGSLSHDLATDSDNDSVYDNQGNLIRRQEIVYGYKWYYLKTKTGKVEVESAGSAHALSSTNPPSTGNNAVHVDLDIFSITEVKEHKAPSPWAAGSYPYYPVKPTFSPLAGGNCGGGDPVDLSNGQVAYLPAPDLVVYNPYGPAAVFHRNWWSVKTRNDGEASPGLGAGWAHNYDVQIKDGKLIYPNGAEDAISGGSHSGPPGAPYYVDYAGSSYVLTFKDGTKWTLECQAGSPNPYLSRIANRVGRYIQIEREKYVDSELGDVYRVARVFDDCTPANVLMIFTYDGRNLTRIDDIYGRRVTYGGGSSSVSQIMGDGGGGSGTRWSYGYLYAVTMDNPSIFVNPHLNQVSFPNPGGAGMSTQTIEWEEKEEVRSTANPVYKILDAKAKKLTDANGNETVFTYNTGSTTVEVKNSTGGLVQTWQVSYDSEHRITGETDAKGNHTTIAYTDPANPYKPTSVTDKNGKTTSFTYDTYGSILTVTSPRPLTTTFTYLYNVFPLGRLWKVQVGNRPENVFTYHEPSGLPHTVTGPEPGTTGGGSTVQSTFTYDDLGNILTSVVPGNNATTTMTTTYNYTTDGTYTQPAKIGQPLTVTDNLGHVTHFRYDARGNVLSAKDAIGNETTFTYNLADQLLTTVFPSTQP